MRIIINYISIFAVLQCFEFNPNSDLNIDLDSSWLSCRNEVGGKKETIIHSFYQMDLIEITYIKTVSVNYFIYLIFSPINFSIIKDLYGCITIDCDRGQHAVERIFGTASNLESIDRESLKLEWKSKKKKIKPSFSFTPNLLFFLSLERWQIIHRAHLKRSFSGWSWKRSKMDTMEFIFFFFIVERIYPNLSGILTEKIIRTLFQE